MEKKSVLVVPPSFVSWKKTASKKLPCEILGAQNECDVLQEYVYLENFEIEASKSHLAGRDALAILQTGLFDKAFRFDPEVIIKE